MANKVPKEIKEMNVNWVDTDDMASITAYSRKMIKQLEAVYEKHPDEVRIIKKNDDGTWCVQLPKKYVHIGIGERSRSKMEMTDEQKAAVAERLRSAREKKGREKMAK